jgi:hypothetical protein
MLNLFNLQRLSWGSSADGQEKVYGTTLSSMLIDYFEVYMVLITTLYFYLQVELSVTELESLRSELAYLEEREAHLKAQ